MKKLDKVELAKKILAMRVRARLRLRAQEQYAQELNDILPDLEKAFDQKTHRGVLPAPIPAIPDVIEG